MSRTICVRMWVCAAFAVFALACLPIRLVAQVASLDSAKMSRIGTVDERFMSYNIEMIEVTGGRFWKPYGSNSNAPAKAQSQ